MRRQAARAAEVSATAGDWAAAYVLASLADQIVDNSRRPEGGSK